MPKPTEKAKAREGSLELDKNLNKIMVVNASAGRGPGQPGYYCDVCSRNHKDSQSYLDHLNGRSRMLSLFSLIGLYMLMVAADLKRLGQTTRVAKSTLDQVRIKIAQLREQSREAAEKKEYDFATRLKEIKAAENNDKVARREQKKEAKALKKAQEDVKPVMTEEEQQMQAMMGFSGFGAGK